MISALLNSWVHGVRSELKNLGFRTPQTRDVSPGKASERTFGPIWAILVPLVICQVIALTVFLTPGLALRLVAALPSLEIQGKSSQLNIGNSLTSSARVEQFEQQLRLKVSQLDAVIREARELDPAIPASSWGELELPALANPAEPAIIEPEGNATEGIGEGDESFYSAHFAPSRHSDDSPGRLSKLSLSDAIDHVTRELKSIPIGYPVEGKLSSGFGSRVSPFSHSVKMHYGVDLSIDRETPVVATADGVVVNTGYEGGFGRVVVVDHGNGMTTLYSHLAKSTVKEGERICRGEIVGHVGASGKATGPHLHYEVHIDGRPQNPTRYLSLAALVNLL